MNFLICPAADYQLDDTEGLFESSSGNFYNFRIEMEEDDMIRLHDSCGRYVPIDMTDVATIGAMLMRIAEYTQSKAEMQQQLFDEIFDGAES